MEKAIMISTITLIIISCIITGNPVVKNDQIINIATGIVGIIFFLYIITKRKKVLTNKMDIGILILCISSAIPLIFNAYTSLSGTIYYIFRYISIFIIYTVISYLINEKKQYKEYIKTAIIFTGTILVLFGIDLMTTEITFDFIKTIIGTKKEQILETRMFSLFFYSNTLAISASVAYILALGEILKEKAQLSYIGILSLLLSAILLTQSRICIILLAIVLIFYFVFLKKENKYKFIKVLFINIIFSLIYIVIFNYLRQAGHTMLIWCITIFMLFGSAFFWKKLVENEKINKMIKSKILIILVAIAIIVFAILLCFTSPLVLFNGEQSQSKMIKEILNIEPSKEYEIKLDVEAISNTEEDNYKIAFIQRNKYSDEITKKEFTINNCNKEICINIITDESIDLIEFNITAKETNENTKLTIKSLKINNKEFILNYRFLPTDIINKLKYISLSQKSVWERVTFIKDGLEISKQNLLFGIGGDGWKYKQFEEQTYFYEASQMHCYFIQILMEFGIIGAMALIFILVKTLKNIIILIYQKQDVDLSIGIAVVILFVHSLLDFNMAFLYIMFIFFILISFLNNNDEKKVIHNKTSTIISIVIIIISTISIYFNCCEIYVKVTQKSSLEKVRTYEEKTKLENKYIFLVPYNEKYKLERAQYLELYLDVKEKELSKTEKIEMKKEEIEILKKCIEIEKGKTDIIDKSIRILKIADSKEEQEYAYGKIENVFTNHRYNANKIYDDYKKIYTLINNEKYINLKDGLFNIIYDNIEKDISYLNEYEKCRITKKQSQEIIEEIQEVNKWNFLYLYQYILEKK